MLGDSAFDTDMPFRTEIIPDQSAILKEIVEDFWRREVHAATPLFARCLAQKRLGPETLLTDDVERSLGKPYLEIRKPAEAGSLSDLERNFERACAAAREIWMYDRAAIGRVLTESGSRNARSYKNGSC